MKKYRKWLGLLLALTMAVSLAACGGGGAEDPNAGKYMGDQINILGWMPMAEVYPGENYLELRGNGKGELTLDSDPIKIKWTLEGEKLTLTADGLESTGRIENGVAYIDNFFGVEMSMTFVKEGATAPVFESEDILDNLDGLEELEEGIEELEDMIEETEAPAEEETPVETEPVPDPGYGKTTPEATGIVDFETLKAGFDWLRFETSSENDYGRPSYEEIREAFGGVDGMKDHDEYWKTNHHVYRWGTEDNKEFCLVTFKAMPDGSEIWGATSWSSGLNEEG